MSAVGVLGYALAAVVAATWVASLVARRRIARDRRIDQQRQRAADVLAREIAASGAAYHTNRDCARSIRDGFIQPVTWDDEPVVRLPESSKEAS